MIDKKRIEEIVTGAISDPSMFLVAVSIQPGNRIVIEVDSDNAIGIDTCMTLSKSIESELDRDVEDFELEVGSIGLTKPFSLPRQYVKNIGNEVEVLTGKGEKLSGVLKTANETEFTVTITKMERAEGAKKKMPVEIDLLYKYEDIKYTKYLIRFK